MKKGHSTYGFQTRTSGLFVVAPKRAGQATVAAQARPDIMTADSMPSNETLERVRARVSKNSTSTQLTLVEDIFSKFGL